jgi:glyoxylate reductase
MAFNVYVTLPIPAAGMDRLMNNGVEVEVNPHERPLTREELLEAVADRDGVLCMLNDRIDAEVFAAAGPKCKVFANYAVGFNNIDIEAASEAGVAITNTPGVLTETTADLTWSLMLSVARRIVEADKYFRSGQWDGWRPMQFLGNDIHGATLGIVGAGRIGTAVAKRGTGFDMKLLYTDAAENEELDGLGGQRVALSDLLQQSDFISLHVPLTEQTHYLIGQEQLSMMKPTAYLINTARGPVIDEKALVEALREGRIAGAGLDVYENEPHPAPGLTDLDNVVCITHLGSATQATRSKMAEMAADNLLAGMQGKRPPNLVNTDVHKKD